MTESRGSLPGSFTEFDLTVSSIAPSELKGNLRFYFGAALFGFVVTAAGSTVSHLGGHDSGAVVLGALSAIHLFASGYYFGRLKSQQ